MKAFADDKLNVNPNTELVIPKVENLVGKGKKCCLLTFSTCRQFSNCKI